MAQTFKHAVIACHPDEHSFTLTVAERYAETIRGHGHEAVIRDLYRMGFNPVLGSDERRLIEERVQAGETHRLRLGAADD